MSLPPEIARLFHNYRAELIDPERDARWVILTVLRDGDWEDHRWLFARYGSKEVARVVREDLEGLQTLPPSVANLWSIVIWGKPLPPRKPTDRWRPTRLIEPQPARRRRRPRLPGCPRQTDGCPNSVEGSQKLFWLISSVQGGILPPPPVEKGELRSLPKPPCTSRGFFPAMKSSAPLGPPR